MLHWKIIHINKKFWLLYRITGDGINFSLVQRDHKSTYPTRFLTQKSVSIKESFCEIDNYTQNQHWLTLEKLQHVERRPWITDLSIIFNVRIYIFAIKTLAFMSSISPPSQGIVFSITYLCSILRRTVSWFWCDVLYTDMHWGRVCSYFNSCAAPI